MLPLKTKDELATLGLTIDPADPHRAIRLADLHPPEKAQSAPSSPDAMAEEAAELQERVVEHSRYVTPLYCRAGLILIAIKRRFNRLGRRDFCAFLEGHGIKPWFRKRSMLIAKHFGAGEKCRGIPLLDALGLAKTKQRSGLEPSGPGGKRRPICRRTKLTTKNSTDVGTHTNGKTRGIVSAPDWIVSGAQELIGGPFDLDVAAQADNAKAPTFFTAEQDGLKQRWTGYKRIWVNPPYNKEQLARWVTKAFQTAEKGSIVVCLLPLWVGYDWWSHVIRGQFIFLYGGNGLPTGPGAMNYVMAIFGGTGKWKLGQWSKHKGMELV